jgi:DNA invertase Pin-like site-specific DNA recombinase
VTSAISEFERSLLLERQRTGIAKAKADGRYKGRAPTAQRQRATILHLRHQGRKPADIAAETGVSRSSVYRILAAVG